MSLLRVAAKNVSRNKGRTALTVAGAAIAVLAFVLLRTVLSAWYAGVDNAARDRLATRHKVSLILPMPIRYLDDVRQVQGVKAATFANWFGAKDPNDPENFFANMAVDSKSFFEVLDEAVVPPEQMAAYMANKKGAIVGDVLAKRLKVKVGDTITLQGTIYPGDWQFQIEGIYTATRKSVDRSQFFFHYDYLNETLPEARKNQIGWIMTRIDQPERSVDISAAIDRVFDERDVQTATMSERNMNNSFMASLSALLTALNAVSAVILVIMLLILGNTIAMGVRERTQEYGVLRALGFLPKHVALFVLGEALTIGVLAGLVGLAISYPIVELGMGRFLEENMGAFFPYFRIDPWTALAAFVATVLLALIAALLPAYWASNLSVVNALRRVG